MGKAKKAREAEAKRKAKQKKITLAAICVSVTVVAAVLIIFSTQFSGIKANAENILDLTNLSVTMLSAEVTKIETIPEKYRDKTIKMSGPYYAVFNEKSGSYRHYVAVKEPDPCCPIQGLEFIFPGGADYPADGTIIEVTGVFKVDYPHYYLETAGTFNIIG